MTRSSYKKVYSRTVLWPPALVAYFRFKLTILREMASADSNDVGKKAEICDEILSLHRSMPDKTV